MVTINVYDYDSCKKGYVILLGECDLSTNLLPENGVAGIVGTGIGGMIEKGNKWINTNPSTIALSESGDIIPIGQLWRQGRITQL